MASASVHLAVLVIAKDPVRADLAAGDVVATRAAAAGHRVISRQSVADSEAAVRSQLARWIDDREVDVVVVLGGGSPVVAKTLATLVTEPVPGTDVIRCGSTFVFVVTGAAGPAMDKLILPQLDAATTTRNLLGQIPRLRARDEGVPVPIVPEKTEGGSGVPARMPASVSMRAKQKTGANVISRPTKPVEDPATKPIDLAHLERQIAKSNTPSHDDVTRPEIALILPRLPPGATSEPKDDDDDDDDDSLDDHTATDTLAVQPAPPLPPPAMPRTRPPSVAPTAVPRVVPPVVKPRAPAPTGEPKPFSFSTPLRGGPPSLPRERTSTGTPAYPARDSKSPIPRTAAPSSEPSRPTASSPPPSATTPAREPSAPSRWTTSTPPPPSAATPLRDPNAPSRPTASAPSKPVPSTPPPSTVTLPREPTASGTSADPAVDAKPRSTPPTTPPPTPAPRDPWRAKSTSSGTPAYPASTTTTPPTTTTPTTTTPTTTTPTTTTPTPAAVENPDADESWTSILAAAKAEPSEEPESDEAWAATVAAAKAAADAVIEPPAPDAVEEIAELDEVDQVDEVAEVPAAAAAVAVEASPAARVREPTPPPPVRVREPTPPPPVRVRQPTPPPPMPVARPVRTPTVPPPANLTSNDLPRGAFTYPDLPKRGNVLLKVAAAIGVTVLGFFAVVYFLDKKDAPSTKVVSETPATPIDPPAAGSAIGTTPGSATPTGSATAEPEIEMDTGEPPPATGSAAISSGSTGSGSATTRPRPGTPTPRPVTTPKTGSAAGSAADTTVATPEPATTTPDPEFTEADLCDEANCVLSDYDRPCCAKYKPKGPVIAQRVGGVPQTLDRSMVRAGVDGIKPRVIACGEKANVQGTVKITVSVSPEGAVTSSDVQDTPDAALGTCVAGALRSAKFGKSIDGGSFTYPFVF